MKENIILKWSLILSIVIVANLFFNYSLSLTLNSPDQEVFCPFEKTSQNITTQQSCEQADGIWNSAPTPGEGIKNAGFCDLYSKCNEAYQDAAEIYEQKVFIALVIIGIVVLIASLFVGANPVLVAAFSLTAVLNFVIASIRYWTYSNDILKVIILFIALLTLIYLVVRKFKDKI